jgi:hypothetical protein
MRIYARGYEKFPLKFTGTADRGDWSVTKAAGVIG